MPCEQREDVVSLRRGMWGDHINRNEPLGWQQEVTLESIPRSSPEGLEEISTLQQPQTGSIRALLALQRC